MHEALFVHIVFMTSAFSQWCDSRLKSRGLEVRESNLNLLGQKRNYIYDVYTSLACGTCAKSGHACTILRSPLPGITI